MARAYRLRNRIRCSRPTQGQTNAKRHVLLRHNQQDRASTAGSTLGLLNSASVPTASQTIRPIPKVPLTDTRH